MKKYILFLLLSILGSTIFANDYSNVEISFNFTPGSLINGNQKDTMDDMLIPTPDSYTSTNYGVNAQLFIFPKNLGIEGTYNFLGTTRAKSNKAGDLEVYDHQIIEIGTIFRYLLKFEGNSYYSFLLSGGATYSILEYSNEFKDLLSEISLYDLTSEWGWYAKIGARYHYNRYFFIGASIQYTFLNNNITVSDKNLDGGYLNIPLQIGISF
ncbi:MAG: outer membrane beta-barrel protein [Spirochaetales bacterium]|nr:outer membrane beta-barrel protein [Spirochaetales bacterium]